MTDFAAWEGWFARLKPGDKCLLGGAESIVVTVDRERRLVWGYGSWQEPSDAFPFELIQVEPLPKGATIRCQHCGSTRGQLETCPHCGMGEL